MMSEWWWDKCSSFFVEHIQASVNTSMYIKETYLCYFLDSRWSDRCETLRVNRVGHKHENSQGPMSIAFANLSYTRK